MLNRRGVFRLPGRTARTDRKPPRGGRRRPQKLDAGPGQGAPRHAGDDQSPRPEGRGPFRQRLVLQDVRRENDVKDVAPMRWRLAVRPCRGWRAACRGIASGTSMPSSRRRPRGSRPRADHASRTRHARHAADRCRVRTPGPREMAGSAAADAGSLPSAGNGTTVSGGTPCRPLARRDPVRSRSPCHPAFRRRPERGAGRDQPCASATEPVRVQSRPSRRGVIPCDLPGQRVGFRVVQGHPKFRETERPQEETGHDGAGQTQGNRSGDLPGRA